MSAPTLNDFISNIKRHSVARQNRFIVSIGGNETGRLVELFCEQATLPSLSFASQPVRTFGEQREVVYERNYESIQLTFLVDRQMSVKNYFDEWMSEVIDPISRLNGYYDDYIRDIAIIVQDTEDNNVYQTVLREAYPKTVASITLDHGSKDVMKLQVTFNYKYHINDLISVSGGEPDITSMYGVTQSNDFKISRKLGDYLKGTTSKANSISDLYYSNFNQYQEKINDALSVSKVLERQGIQIGRGAII